MEEKKTAKPGRDRDIDWSWIGHTTDHFSEVLFELTKVADSLKSCADSLDYISSRDFCGYTELPREIKDAKRMINNIAKTWADDELFQAEIKIRLEVLRLQKKHIVNRLEEIGRKLSSIRVSFDGLKGKEEK